MKDDRQEPINIYINIIVGDVTNSSVVQGGMENVASLLHREQLPDYIIKYLVEHIQDTS